MRSGIDYVDVAVSATGGAAMTFSPAAIALDRTSPVPLYYQVAQQFEQLIESGATAAGHAA
jgi:hypothetical protein